MQDVFQNVNEALIRSQADESARANDQTDTYRGLGLASPKSANRHALSNSFIVGGSTERHLPGVIDGACHQPEEVDELTSA